ncbi:hypothetical protein JCGZ_22090 [Jatropha curcas]|uniref:Uncharacterized protein n=1 Tax=Jatropha curcas TaxID=180498 RepID=A0A067K430_JATCU|nr:hypothetical protein JCGZ_22090 [Jatropha curcas]
MEIHTPSRDQSNPPPRTSPPNGRVTTKIEASPRPRLKNGSPVGRNQASKNRRN